MEGIYFNVPNMSSLINRREGSVLSFDIAFFKEDQMPNLSHCKSCLAVNGRRCLCFADELADIKPFLHEGCISRDSAFLLSMYFDCPGGEKAVSTPVYVPLLEDPVRTDSTWHNRRLTLVLPLELSDMQRYTILLTSLTLLTSDSVHELMVIVPDLQAQTFFLLSKGFSELLNFPIRIVAESHIVPPPPVNERYYPYAIQMAIKLLVARVVQTDFYITLDADVILLRNFEYSDLVISGRGVYHHEERLIFHPDWWEKSEQFIGFHTSSTPEKQGFGATPAVLSAYGALLVLEKIHERMNYAHNFIELWLLSFGVTAVWSEYTLYRLVLDEYRVIAMCMTSSCYYNSKHECRHDIFCSYYFFQIFDYLHIREGVDNNKRLQCNPVWFPSDLPWRPEEAYSNESCIFSLVQSTSNASPSYVFGEVARMMSIYNDNN